MGRLAVGGTCTGGALTHEKVFFEGKVVTAAGKPGTRHLYFVRHGMREDFENPAWRETAANPHDTPLSAAGLRQAEDIAEALRGEGISHVFSSPFLRALETAHPLAAGLGLPLRIEPGLSEWLNPDWFTAPPRWMPVDEAATRFPQVDTGYVAAVQPEFPEPSETEDVFDRVGRTLNLLLDRYPEGNAAFFAHGASLAQGIAGLIGGLEGVDLRTAAITRVAIADGHARLIASGGGHLREEDSQVRFH